MNPQTITALAGLVIYYAGPWITGLPFFAEAPDAAHFAIEALRDVIVGALILLTGMFSPTVQERIGRVAAPIIAHLEDTRAGRSNLDLRKLAVDLLKDQASQLGVWGLIFRLPIIGSWFAGAQIDAAASGVKKAIKTL